MLRTLVLAGGALAAMLWLVHQPAYQHNTPHKQLGALIAITVPFLVLDIILGIRRRRRARRARPSPAAPARSSRARTGARW
jgi:hypothetical protein